MCLNMLHGQYLYTIGDYNRCEVINLPKSAENPLEPAAPQFWGQSEETISSNTSFHHIIYLLFSLTQKPRSFHYPFFL